eukprot:14358206-Alexandrium_andersonii.AAC.2
MYPIPHPPLRGRVPDERPRGLRSLPLEQHLQLLTAERTAGSQEVAQPRWPKALVEAMHADGPRPNVVEEGGSEEGRQLAPCHHYL